MVSVAPGHLVVAFMCGRHHAFESFRAIAQTRMTEAIKGRPPLYVVQYLHKIAAMWDIVMGSLRVMKRELQPPRSGCNKAIQSLGLFISVDKVELKAVLSVSLAWGDPASVRPCQGTCLTLTALSGSSQVPAAVQHIHSIVQIMGSRPRDLDSIFFPLLVDNEVPA